MTTIAEKRPKSPEEVALDRAIARTKEILERLLARQRARLQEAELTLALSRAQVPPGPRVISPEEHAAMDDIHGGHPDDPEYCAR